MPIVQEIAIPEFEKVLEIVDETIGLHAFIAIHNTTLGPALGGLRMFPYTSRDDALTDVLRLARGMSYKSAVAGLPLGGGKAVIIANPQTVNKTPLLLAFAEALHQLGGDYITAEDMGTSPEDMAILRGKTPYVAALWRADSSGDPSRFTAWGTLRGMQAVAETLWGNPSLQGKRIAIQGLGHVGAKLAEHLFWHGAHLVIADANAELIRGAAALYRAEIMRPDEILYAECDILAPCAIGGILNDDTIPRLRCQAVAGAANNQLFHTRHGFDLMDRGILYAPDYIINSGGLINAAAEFAPGGYNILAVRDKVDQLKATLRAVFTFSALQNKPTSQIVDELAEERLQQNHHALAVHG